MTTSQPNNKLYDDDIDCSKCPTCRLEAANVNVCSVLVKQLDADTWTVKPTGDNIIDELRECFVDLVSVEKDKGLKVGRSRQSSNAVEYRLQISRLSRKDYKVCFRASSIGGPHHEH